MVIAAIGDSASSGKLADALSKQAGLSLVPNSINVQPIYTFSIDSAPVAAAPPPSGSQYLDVRFLGPVIGGGLVAIGLALAIVWFSIAIRRMRVHVDPSIFRGGDEPPEDEDSPAAALDQSRRMAHSAQVSTV